MDNDVYAMMFVQHPEEEEGFSPDPLHQADAALRGEEDSFVY